MVEQCERETAGCRYVAVDAILSDIRRAEHCALKLKGTLQVLAVDLARIGDDAQLANVDLQSFLQKTQQSLQLLFNVSKISHDMATAIIRKIGG